MQLLCFLLFMTQNPSQTLLEARLHRDSQALHSLKAEVVGEGLFQDVLMTYGQIGNPQDAPRIVPFFTHPDLGNSAIFAYGEIAGAPLDPLLDLTPPTDSTKAYLWLEAMAKLAAKGDHKRLVAAWQTLSLANQHATVGLLYGIKTMTLQILAPQRLSQKANGEMVNYVYYLMRSRTSIPQDLALNLLEAYEQDGDTLALVLRLTTLKTSPELADAYAARTRHTDWRVRNQAIGALTRVDPNRGARQALGLLLDPNPNVVRTAIRQINAAKVPMAIENLHHANQGLSPSQLQTLYSANQKPHIQEMAEITARWLGATDVWTHLHAIRLLGQDTSQHTTEHLIQLAQSDNAITAAVAIGQLEGRDHSQIKAIAKDALLSKDPYKMAAAVALIGEDSELRQIAAQAARVKQPEVDFHYAWIATLVARDDAEAKLQLSELCDHPDYLVRLKAFQETSGTAAKVFAGGWQHEVPAELIATATRFRTEAPPTQWLLKTTKGLITIDLHTAYAPINAANIVSLTQKGYFNGMALHRVVPNFVVQGGDPRGDGSGGPGYAVPCEINPHRFVRGTVGMALAGKDTGGSQFFICHSAQPHLDGGYTVFGQVRSGMDVIDQLEESDRIIEASIR